MIRVCIVMLLGMLVTGGCVSVSVPEDINLNLNGQSYYVPTSGSGGGDTDADSREDRSAPSQLPCDESEEDDD